jgi:hypothetical protein
MQGRNKLTEKQVDTYLRTKVEEQGGLCIKMGNVHRLGFPDRLVILPGKKPFFVEVKRSGRELEAYQRVWFHRMFELGISCWMTNSYESVDDVLRIESHRA